MKNVDYISSITEMIPPGLYLNAPGFLQNMYFSYQKKDFVKLHHIKDASPEII